MYVFKQPLPTNEKLSEQRFVKIVESLVGYQLSSYPLYIIHSVGFALYLSVVVFVLTFIGSLVIESASDISNVFVIRIIDSSQLFLFMVFGWFLILVGQYGLTAA